MQKASDSYTEHRTLAIHKQHATVFGVRAYGTHSNDILNQEEFWAPDCYHIRCERSGVWLTVCALIRCCVMPSFIVYLPLVTRVFCNNQLESSQNDVQHLSRRNACNATHMYVTLYGGMTSHTHNTTGIQLPSATKRSLT